MYSGENRKSEIDKTIVELLKEAQNHSNPLSQGSSLDRLDGFEQREYKNAEERFLRRLQNRLITTSDQAVIAEIQIQLQLLKEGRFPNEATLQAEMLQIQQTFQAKRCKLAGQLGGNQVNYSVINDNEIRPQDLGSTGSSNNPELQRQQSPLYSAMEMKPQSQQHPTYSPMQNFGSSAQLQPQKPQAHSVGRPPVHLGIGQQFVPTYSGMTNSQTPPTQSHSFNLPKNPGYARPVYSPMNNLALNQEMQSPALSNPNFSPQQNAHLLLQQQQLQNQQQQLFELQQRLQQQLPNQQQLEQQQRQMFELQQILQQQQLQQQNFDSSNAMPSGHYVCVSSNYPGVFPGTPASFINNLWTCNGQTSHGQSIPGNYQKTNDGFIWAMGGSKVHWKRTS